MSAQATTTFSGPLLARAAGEAFAKLDPRALVKNPAIFVTEVVALLVTVLFVRDLAVGAPAAFTGQIAA